MPDGWNKPENRELLERTVNELISLISLLTCWTNKPCETFLNSERVECIDLGAFDPCGCCEGIVSFNPYYTPFNPNSFKVQLVILDGIKETIIEINKSDYIYSETFCALRIDIRDYVEFNNCGCQKGYKLRITYDAGYELLPECLLPLFCDILHVLLTKNECDCSKCKTCNELASQGVIEYVEGDNLSPLINSYLNSLLLSGYRKQLNTISLCERCSNGFWSVVV